MAERTRSSERDAPAAQVGAIAKCYGEVCAVAGVSFDVVAGELLTLLGPSGCGKTTTMRAIAGLERIDAGEIRLKDRVVSSAATGMHVAPERRDVGMVFQSYAIWPHMSVFENVAYPLRCRQVGRRELRERVDEGLALVGMTGYEDRQATMLSGGQQQRVALARALVMRPSILLLDEPLCNLDAKLRVQMRAHIKELQAKTGLTMVYVTHDQLEAMALSDRIIVMHAGAIEQVGAPEDIYERPRNRFVAEFVGAINLVGGTVADVRPSEGFVSVATGGGTLACAVGDAPVPVAGSPVLMMVRPEKIAVETAATPAGGADGPVNRLAGRIAANVYYGDRRELTVACDGFALQVAAANDVTVPIGAEVRVAFAARDLRLLQEDAGLPTADAVPAPPEPAAMTQGLLARTAAR